MGETLGTRKAASQYAGKRQRATIGAIASEAGMVPGTIYHHFGGRDELIADVVDELIQAVGDGMRRASRAVDDPVVRIALAGVGLVDRAMADREFARAFGRLLDPVTGLRAPLHDQVAEVVAVGVSTGRFASPDGADGLAVDALLAVASAAALRVAGGELTVSARRSVAEMMLAVVGVGRGEARRAAGEARALIDAASPGKTVSDGQSSQSRN